MARVRQGEVYLANVVTRIGFAAEPELLVVVLQGNALNSVLETLLVAPLVSVSDERVRFVPYRSLDRTRAASLALHRAPGPKCYVDSAGRVSRFAPIIRTNPP